MKLKFIDGVSWAFSLMWILEEKSMIFYVCSMMQGNSVETGISATPDDAFFKHLASTYATNHQTMQEGRVCTR